MFNINIFAISEDNFQHESLDIFPANKLGRLTQKMKTVTLDGLSYWHNTSHKLSAFIKTLFFVLNVGVEKINC